MSAQLPKLGDNFTLFVVYWKEPLAFPVTYMTPATSDILGKFTYLQQWHSPWETWGGWVSELDHHTLKFGREGLVGYSHTQEGAEALRLQWVKRTIEKAQQDVVEAVERLDKWGRVLEWMHPKAGEGDTVALSYAEQVAALPEGRFPVWIVKKDEEGGLPYMKPATGFVQRDKLLSYEYDGLPNTWKWHKPIGTYLSSGTLLGLFLTEQEAVDARKEWTRREARRLMAQAVTMLKQAAALEAGEGKEVEA